jgi:hypothetical protein
MKVNLIKKVIATVFIAALFLVPVFIVVLQFSAKQAEAYNPYVSGYSYSLDGSTPDNKLKSKDTQKTKNTYCQDKYDINYVFQDWYCVPNSLDFKKPQKQKENYDSSCVYYYMCYDNPNSLDNDCFSGYMCTRDENKKLTDSDCKNSFGRNYTLSDGQCVVNSLDFEYAPNYNNKTMDCLSGYIDLGDGCVEGVDLFVPSPINEKNDFGVGYFESDYDLFQNRDEYDGPRNMNLPWQDIEGDAFWNL